MKRGRDSREFNVATYTFVCKPGIPGFNSCTASYFVCHNQISVLFPPQFCSLYIQNDSRINRSTIYSPLRTKLADVFLKVLSVWFLAFFSATESWDVQNLLSQKSVFNFFSYHSYWSAVFLWVQVLVYNRKGYTWIADIAQNLFCHPLKSTISHTCGFARVLKCFFVHTDNMGLKGTSTFWPEPW